MTMDRRNILKKFVIGLMAGIGFFLPNQLWARRRWRRCQPSYPTVCEPIGQSTLLPPTATLGDFQIAFPDEATVQGGGSFFAWGSPRTNKIIAKKATCGGITGNQIAVPNGWAFQFNGVAKNTPLTLTISGMDMTDPLHPVAAQPSSFGTFTCV